MLMSNVVSITFVFENCESIDFPIKYVGSFYIGEISSCIKRLALNSVKRIDVAKELFVELFNEGDEEYNYYCTCGKFERIMKYRDIVYIEVKYDDGNADTVYVDYDGEGQNKNQDNWVSKLGNMYVAISRKRFVNDFISEKDANDKDSVNLRKPIELLALQTYTNVTA